MYKRLTECRSNEVAAMDKKNTIVVLPVAAHEQHGKHLPVGTDTIILEGVLESFGRRGPYWCCRWWLWAKATSTWAFAAH